MLKKEIFNFILSKIQTRFNLLSKTTLKDKNQSILTAYCINITCKIHTNKNTNHCKMKYEYISCLT